MSFRSFVAVPLLLAASQTISSPAAEKSEYLETVSGHTVSNQWERPGEMNVSVQLRWLKRPPKGSHMVVEFSNEQFDGYSFVIETAVANLPPKVFQLLSPPYSCVINHSNYLVRVWVFSDKARSRLVATHEQPVELSLHPRALSAFRLTEC